VYLNAGLARGAYAVGYMYELGLGVPQNLEGALERYRGVALMASQKPSLDSAAVGEARGASLKALALAAQVLLMMHALIPSTVDGLYTTVVCVQREHTHR
jgi:hypothetical protein